MLEQFISASDECMTRIEREIAQLRASINDLRIAHERDFGDLRASISGLRDIVVGHEKRVIP